MENNELKNVCIKNCMCYYFDDMIRIEGNVLLDEKSYENILIYSISYKTLIGAKPFVCHFVLEKYDAIYDRIRCCRIGK